MSKEFKIIKCKPLDNYKLDISFADGKHGIIDLKHLAGKGVFVLWNDYKEFQKVKIDPITKTVCWRNEIDLDPVNIRNNLKEA